MTPMRTMAVGLLASLVLAAGACGGGAGDAEQFCTEVGASREAILGAPSTTDEIDDFVGLYRRLGEVAPLAIDQEWEALVLNYETASTVVPGDPESVQRVMTQAVRTERSAQRVRLWLLTNCEIDLGNAATISGSVPGG